MPTDDCQTSSLAVLYASLSPELERMVHANVQASEPLIEEACQIAWGSLVMRHNELTPGTELGWLATTATREALNLLRAQRRDLSLEQEQDEQGELLELAFEPGPEQVVELHERLAEVRHLPIRQRQMVMLQGFGYRYEEIAQFTGASRRTVERQLLRAKRRLAS